MIRLTIGGTVAQRSPHLHICISMRSGGASFAYAVAVNESVSARLRPEFFFFTHKFLFAYGFDWIRLGFIGFIEFFIIASPSLLSVVPSFSGFHFVLFFFTGFYWSYLVLPSFALDCNWR